MPAAVDLVREAQQGLWVALVVSLPVLVAAALVSLVAAALQAASQIQDPTLSHLPRLLAVLTALAIAGPWMAHEVGAFAEHVLVYAAAAR
ncbi:MAG: flagellar biosynthetic protein FliQ [Polyangiaceae bacterium]